MYPPVEPLPDGLVEMAPGPGLATALASVDRSRLSGADVCELVAARARQVAYEQAQLLADLAEAGRVIPQADPAMTRKPGLDRFSADEAAFTLCWSVESVAAHQALAADL